MTETPKDYKATVFLPRTSFPMRADLPKREPDLLQRWAQMELLQRQRELAAGKPSFVLHDGPPYANGNLHIGHALNKIHKDVINRAQFMSGRDVDYIPGWDCHGLPIEWKIEEQYRAKKLDKDQVPVLEFRKQCREYAQHWLQVQSAEFQRLGVAGDWANRYATMDFTSEAFIAGEIGKFLLNGALYRGLRPVMWSPVEKTALAEAEIEYQDKKDTAIYVRFPAAPGEVEFAGASLVIWTTTPWTIPGNRGLAVGRELEYALITIEDVSEDSLLVVGEHLVVGAALLEAFAQENGLVAYREEQRFKGEALAQKRFYHPLASQDEGYNFTVPVLLGDFVTMDAGTGIVHMAPGHGEDDFLLCKANAIVVPDTVAGDGTYYESVPLFAGLHVYKAADPVCKALTAAGNLVRRAEFMHSYPHSWRSKAPLIYRATAQWFIRMEGDTDLRGHALKALADTRFVPEAGRNRIRAMVEIRPDWCISRQRAWGVPIAIFVDKRTHEPLRDQAVMDRVVSLFMVEGADAWYARPASDFLGPDRNPDDYEQIFDVVDVWFESGSTHAFVLEARGMKWPADVYLEGSDQHRGWFQSSLLEAVGTRGQAPFKTIVTDGFVLDEQGRKMSKSLGNVTAPQEVNDKYGADILRLWVLNSDIADDLRIGPEILKQQAELYRRLRNSLRWILGSLDGFDESEHVPVAEYPDLEKFLLHRLWELHARLKQAVESHDWSGFYPALHQFCTADLSAFYFDIRKDSLYCDAPSSPVRRACRSFLDLLFRCLATWLAPALPFTAEEAWMCRYGADQSVHLQAFEVAGEDWRDDALAARFAKVRAQRADVTGAIEKMRADKRIGSSLQAQAVLSAQAKTLCDDTEFWSDICITSAARFGDANGADLAVGEKCERCWQVRLEVGSHKAHPTLCKRCCEAVAELS